MTAERVADDDEAILSVAVPELRRARHPRIGTAAHAGTRTYTAALPGVAQLYFAVETSRRDGAPLIVQFVGAGGGEGVSTVVSGYVRQAARRANRRILVVRCAAAPPGAGREFRSLPDLLDVFQAGQPLHEATCALPGDDLEPARARLATLGEHAADTLDPSMLGSFAEALRDSFGLVVLDCPGVAANPLAAVLSRIADGTIVVVAAGRTRRRGLQRAVAEINGMGGQVVGLVLNRQRDWLPGWLRRLIA